MLVAQSIVEAVVHRLVEAGCVSAAQEAADFLAAAPDAPTLEAWLRRREQGEPPGWITGTVRFCGHSLHIAPGVYVPRAQSEVLARRAARLLPAHGRAIDLCTGSGAIAAHLKAMVPAAMVVGIDVDPMAAACAHRNGVPTLVADLDDPVRAHPGFDLVTAVVPYVPTGDLRLLPSDVQRFEPRRALDGGADGLDLVRRVVSAAGHLLHPGGWLLIEVGGDQDEALAPHLATDGFDLILPWWDDDDDLRGIAARTEDSNSDD